MSITSGLARSMCPAVVIALLMLVIVSACSSKQELALKHAKQLAAASKQAQQVVSTDKSGNTTTIIVQPPASGQTESSITTVITPHAAGTPMPAQSGPVVSAMPVEVSIPAGTVLTIRIDQSMSAKNSRAGQAFTGEILEPVLAANSNILIPKLSRVTGIVDAAHQRGRFRGSSYLQLLLTSVTLNGNKYTLATQDLTRSQKGKGRRSTALIAGGAGLGMLVGGLTSGGTGMAVGGLIGGGAGTAVAGLTGNRDLVIPAESIVHFTLAEELTITLGPQQN